METHFKEKLNSLFSHIADPGQLIVDEDIRCLIFGDYMKKGGEDKLYDEIQDLDELREVSGVTVYTERVNSRHVWRENESLCQYYVKMQTTTKYIVFPFFLVFCCIGEYISLDLFCFVNLTSSCLLISFVVLIFGQAAF